MNVIKNIAEYDAILKDNEKVFVDFYADWCGPCKMVGPLVEQLSNEISDVTFVKVNVDEQPEIAQRYGIMSIPTLIAFKNGQAVTTTVGFKPKEELEQVIKAL
ncbi:MULTISPECIES: thioredoxin [Terrabacteria group]|uniref:thioredoxin n=1 Tax=Bacillati TaxID=1783272 RepID=UPI001C6F1A65|nr:MULTISPECIES: thioredoxin [Terrabacteria group]MBW9212266.1 thioredoxin [Trueperella sp. zg.1013]